MFTLGLSLSGCWLKLASANMIIVPDIASEVNEIITTVFSDSTASVCLEQFTGYYECTYIVEGNILTSTAYLLAELGLAGVIIDPIIVQVADDARLLEASYDLGSGAQPLVSIPTPRFEAQPGVSIQAEPGHKFFILELPQSVVDNLPAGDPTAGTAFDFTLRFESIRPISQPVPAQSIKVMLTAKVAINGHTYYPPLLPCVDNFGAIPAIEIPQAQTPQNLMPAILSALQGGSNVVCDHMGYYFDAAPPPFSNVAYLPLAYK
jgi:hypothetical protein